jgi:hypothetical protein
VDKSSIFDFVIIMIMSSQGGGGFVFLKDQGRKAPFRYFGTTCAHHFRTGAGLPIYSYTRHIHYLATFTGQKSGFSVFFLILDPGPVASHIKPESAPANTNRKGGI